MSHTFLWEANAKGDVSVFSGDFMEKYELKTHSHVQRLVKSLEKKGVLDEGKIVDIFFKEWLKRLGGEP